MRGKRNPPPSARPSPSPAPPSDDVVTLRQCFPAVDSELVGEVYTSCGRDFEKAYLALSALQGEGGGGRVSAQQCLAFLVAVFDQLNPQFVEDTLIRAGGSVEGEEGVGMGRWSRER